MDGTMEQLARQARAGDREAFTSLVLQNEAVLSRTAMSLLGNPEDAADAVQEAIFEAWKNLAKLRRPQYFRTWLTRILIRKCYGQIEQRDKHLHSGLEEELDSAEEPDLTEVMDVRAVLNRLDKGDKLILGLYYHDGFSIAEIANILHVSRSAAKQRLYRSRRKFQAIYTEQGKEEISHET